MKFFWVLWGFDAVITLIFLYFFFVGLADGSVSSSNAGLWFLILAGLGGILLAGYWLQNQHQQGWALALLCVLAIPGLLAGLFFLITLVTGGPWN